MPEQPPHAEGTVTANPVALRAETFLLEDDPNPTAGHRYYVRVDSRSQLYRRSFNGDLTTVTLEEIAVGATVQVWFDGPVLESDPSQAVADFVLVNDVILD